MPAPGPEFAAVCALIAPGAALRAIPKDCDEELVRRIAVRHQVAGLVTARLAAGEGAVPAGLARAARRGHELALRQLSAAFTLRDAMAAAGIDALFLKGQALSQRAWGSPLARLSVDIDLLVAPQQVDQAWQVLAQQGYVRSVPESDLTPPRARLFRWASKDSIHCHPDSGVVLELHWRMTDDPAATLPPSAGRQLVEVAPGEQLATLADPQLFAYLVGHGAAHAWARLKWLADIAALLVTAEDHGHALLSHAQAAAGETATASAALLAEELLGLTLPPGYVARRTWRTALLLRLARAALLDGGGARDLAASPARGWTEMAAKILVAPGLSGLAAVLRRLALSGEDIAQVALPPALHWAYPLLRIPLLVRRRLARARGRG